MDREPAAATMLSARHHHVATTRERGKDVD